MPSKRQKAKARESREMDMMSDLDNLDLLLGSGNENPFERELADAIEQRTTGQMSIKRTIIETLYEKMSLLNKMKLDSLLRLSRTNITSDCLKKWIP